MYNKELENRFLKYVSFDTQSSEETGTVPSTMKQKDLGAYLVEELKRIGLDNAYMDEYGYVYAYLKGEGEAVGLIAHMDTSDEASGKDVKPVIIPSYDGGVIEVNKDLNLYLDPKDFSYMNKQLGHRIIHTDGTTLLGADDKAGIAIIIETVAEIIKGKLPHPSIIITFTPDEEIGGGTAKFNYDYYKIHNCTRAYTLDGDAICYLNYENFNAASAKVTITGKSIHPGSAKNKMINSQLLAMEFNSLLPSNLLPSLTEGYEGFNHLTNIEGTVSSTTMHYIIRNHDKALFEKQKADFVMVKNFINEKYGPLCDVVIEDSYYNMLEKVMTKSYLLDNARKALAMHNIVSIDDPIRGGTDGARLSFEGIITPNLGTGGGNYHGPLEYLDMTEASMMVEVMKSLLELFTE